MSRDLSADAEDAKAQGNAALAAKDFDTAIKWYTQALDFSKRLPLPNNRHVYFSNRSAAYLSKGFADSALKDAVACIEANPTWPKGFGRKGAALHAQRKYDEAIKAYEEGLAVAPGDESLKQGLAQVQQDKAAPPPMAHNDDDAEGGLAGILHDPDALNRLRAHPKTKAMMEDPTFVRTIEMVRDNPQLLQMLLRTDPRIMTALGVLMGIDLEAMQGASQESKEQVKEAEKARKEREAAAEKARLEREEQERLARETPEERAAREAKARALAKKNEGNNFYKARQFDEALQAYEAAVAEDPTDMTFLLNKASVFLEQKDLAKCIQACDEALEVGKANHASYENLAKALERKGNAYFKHDMLEDALREYKRAQVESRSSDVDEKIRKTERLLKDKAAKAYVDPVKGAEAKERGNVLFKAGDFAGAVKEYTEAIARDPSSAVYHVNRAAALTKLTDFGRALEDAEAAVKLDPKYVKAYARKGKIEQATKKFHRALDSFKKGLELDPNDAECLEGLTQVTNAVNRHDEDDSVRSARAMEDPEIRAIMTDPVMAQVLRDLSSDPKSARHHLANEGIRAKLEKLIAAGIVKTS